MTSRRRKLLDYLKKREYPRYEHHKGSNCAANPAWSQYTQADATAPPYQFLAVWGLQCSDPVWDKKSPDPGTHVYTLKKYYIKKHNITVEGLGSKFNRNNCQVS